MLDSVVSHPYNQDDSGKRKVTTYVLGQGIERAVLISHVKDSLGSDASVRAVRDRSGVAGYLIHACRPFTDAMREEVQKASKIRIRKRAIVASSYWRPYDDDSPNYAPARSYYPSLPMMYRRSHARRRQFYSDKPASADLEPFQGYCGLEYRSVENWHSARSVSSASYDPRHYMYRPSALSKEPITESDDVDRPHPELTIHQGTVNPGDSASQPPEHSEQLQATDSPRRTKPQITVDTDTAEQDTFRELSDRRLKTIKRLVEDSFGFLANNQKLLYETADSTTAHWSSLLEELSASSDSIEASFTSCSQLGCGAFGEVDEVSAKGGIGTVARKRLKIPRRKHEAARRIQVVQEEIASLKSLAHPHIVRIIGSYQQNQGTTKHIYSLLMHPVGDNDLSGFLEDDCACIATEPGSEASIRKSAWIMKWFTCLAGALAYMHSQNIHHEDIKPKNIIHKGEHVYFTDFSSARRCEAGGTTSTVSPASTTRLFAAPEALPTADGELSRHGSRTDVFSLGLVFVEMLTILEGNDIDDLHDYLDRNSGFANNDGGKQYHRAINLMDDWFSSSFGHTMFVNCIKPMLKKERTERPNAEEVVALIREHQPWGKTLACPCKDSPPAASGLSPQTSRLSSPMNVGD